MPRMEHVLPDAGITDRLLDVRTVASILGLSEVSVWRHVRAGVLPSVKLIGARRIALSAVERVLREGIPVRRAC
jgi:predicted DNA-binding transcriptional regulator AlpA